jgi:hypothetical protein
MLLRDTEKLNADVRDWARRVANQVKGRAPSLDQLKGKVRSKDGVPVTISFVMPKHYIYREKGVGKGRKIGSGKETPKPDINESIKARLPELEAIAAAGMAEVVAKNLFIK